MAQCEVAGLSSLHGDGPSVLGVLPVRAGSKGLPGKNMMEIAGKSLLRWSGEALVGSKNVGRSICSTDSEEMGREAEAIGLMVPGLRPSRLSTDESTILALLQYLLAEELHLGFQYSYVAVVQATSPTVLPADVDGVISVVVESGSDSGLTVSEVPHRFHPASQFFERTPGQIVTALNDGSTTLRRQSLPRAFRKAGLVYVFSTVDIVENNRLYGSRIAPVAVEPTRAITIDSEQDFLEARLFLEKQVRASEHREW